MDIDELTKRKTKLEVINNTINREFENLIIQLTSNLVNKRIFTPIFIGNDYRNRVGINKNGIKKYESGSVAFGGNLKNIKFCEYQDIYWMELVDWIKNHTKLDSNIFYQIGRAVYNYKFRPVEIFYYLDEDEIIEDKFSYNKNIIDKIAIIKYYNVFGNDNIWDEDIIKYKEILKPKIWDQVLFAISEFNRELDEQNKHNQEVINNLKKELSYILILEEI